MKALTWVNESVDLGQRFSLAQNRSIDLTWTWVNEALTWVNESVDLGQRFSLGQNRGVDLTWTWVNEGVDLGQRRR